MIVPRYKVRVVTYGPYFKTTDSTTYDRTKPILSIRVSKTCIGIDNMVLSMAPDGNCTIYGRFDFRHCRFLSELRGIEQEAEALVDVKLETSFTHEQPKMQQLGIVYDLPEPNELIEIYMRTTDSAKTVGCNIYFTMTEIYEE